MSLDYTKNYKKYNINNFSVYHVYSTNEKSVRIQYMVKSGNFVENKINSGVAHLLEHILLESWKECFVKQNCVRYWEDKGISYNAYTAGILVSFYIFGLLEYKDLMIQFFENIFTVPVITDKILSDAKKAVREELLNYLNDPKWKFNDSVYKTIYSNKENGLHYLLDYKLQLDNLEKLSKEDVYDYFSKWYTPENSIFVYIAPESSYKDIQKFNFNGVRNSFSKEVRLLTPENDNKQNKGNTFFIKRTGSKKVGFKIAFKTDKYNSYSNEIKYLQLVKGILCGDLSSYIYKILRIDNNLIYDIVLDFEITENSVTAIFSMSSKKESSKKLLYIFIESMKTFLNDFDEQLLITTKKKLFLKNSDFYKNTEQLGIYYCYEFINKKTNVEDPDERIEEILNISKEDFLQICRTLFSFDNIHIFYEYSKKLFNVNTSKKKSLRR